eukprot:1049144-Prymnesium_polylepis.1
MRARHPVQRAILQRLVVERDVHGQVRHRPRPVPVRVVLVPLDDGARAARLDKRLVVPEADGTAVQQLTRRQADAVEVSNVVHRRLDTPVPEAVEEHLAAALRLVVVQLVEQVELRVRARLVGQHVEVRSQLLDARHTQPTRRT